MATTTYHDYIQSSKELDRIYHESAVKLGIPDSAMVILFSLWEDGEGVTPTRLYREWALSKQTGHSALMWLERKGLVRLVPLPKDGRSKGVFFTDWGRRYAGEAIEPQLAAERAAFGRLTGEEQEALLRLTNKIIANLKEERAGLVFPALKNDL